MKKTQDKVKNKAEEKTKEKKSIVVIGGGTGTYTVLKGLKKHRDKLKIKAIVTMADSGGSTGRLRDEFGYLPVGDVRMALVALASEVNEHDELLRTLFLHRFEKGEGLSGHNFGNLFLVALCDILGSEEEAIKAASRVLRVCGEVIPVTTEKSHLVAEYDDGVIVKGEHEIEEMGKDRNGSKITKLTLTPEAFITGEARNAIKEADIVVLGPGDLYTSLFANCVVNGVREAFRENKGKFIYIANLMTRAGQTHSMNIADHVSEVANYTGRHPDVILVNNADLPEDLLVRYAEYEEFPVSLEYGGIKEKVKEYNLLAAEETKTSASDTLRRSLIRHDSDKLAEAIMKLL